MDKRMKKAVKRRSGSGAHFSGKAIAILQKEADRINRENVRVNVEERAFAMNACFAIAMKTIGDVPADRIAEILTDADERFKAWQQGDISSDELISRAAALTGVMIMPAEEEEGEGYAKEGLQSG